jgi:hypothetical protein
MLYIDGIARFIPTLPLLGGFIRSTQKRYFQISSAILPLNKTKKNNK